MKKNESILITGASTGIGKETALYLDKMGFMVFAGVRNSKDGDRLKAKASDRLKPIILDVTKEQTIQNAVKEISKESEHTLVGLVNNAGIGMRSVLEIIPKEEFQKVFDINVVGLHSVTVEFLPLLRKNRGRIVNIGSEAGFIAGAGGGAYSASKFAVRALTDALRLEMIPFGVFVSYVAPTSTESKIWDKNKEDSRFRKGISPELHKGYNYFFKAQDRATKERIQPMPAIEVVKDIADALFSSNPQYEYCSGSKSREAYEMSLLPKEEKISEWIERLTEYIRLYG